MALVANAAVVLRKHEHTELASEMEQVLIRELIGTNGTQPTPAKPAKLTVVSSTPKRRKRKAVRRVLDEATLEKIAKAYNDSETGGRTQAVSKAIGCAPKSVGYYVGRARQAGYIT
ncbi:hypothetical protein AVU99_gp075 [Mycobacterium phage Lolly9]|uniref:Helix-turn-helix DNA binding domain protein n=1 Tax=Mycobacterium phage Lolly9 TaxID=1698711 RepID=A0A0K2FMT1_9CAUD|nr:hypothetical protein AVU99_gp075 [Mycobacterium phage Lolly9]ALA48522.1 hypothetical protein LOLLY9_113 [Mycobacterium phage Lolly9]